jgi:hypothetical protein
MLSKQLQVEIPRLSETTADVAAWFKRYELACKMRSWVKSETEDPRLEYLDFFFDDAVLVAYEELPELKKKTYDEAKAAIINRFARSSRDSYADFVTARYDSSHSVDSFVDQLKRALIRAIPNIPAEVVESMVLEQFLLSLPLDKRAQVLLTTEREGVRLRLAEALEKARAVMPRSGLLQSRVVTARVDGVSAAVTPGAKPKAVAFDMTPTRSPTDRSRTRCYNCNSFGHFASACPRPPKKSKNVSAGAETKSRSPQ